MSEPIKLDLDALEQAATEIASGHGYAWSSQVVDDVMCVGCIDGDGNFADFIDVRISDYSGDEADDAKLADFLAMCRPAVVLELVRRLRLAESQRQGLLGLLNEAYGYTTAAVDLLPERIKAATAKIEAAT